MLESLDRNGMSVRGINCILLWISSKVVRCGRISYGSSAGVLVEVSGSCGSAGCSDPHADSAKTATFGVLKNGCPMCCVTRWPVVFFSTLWKFRLEFSHRGNLGNLVRLGWEKIRPLRPVSEVSMSVVLHLVGGNEPHKFHTCIHRSLCRWKNKCVFLNQTAEPPNRRTPGLWSNLA